MPPDLTPAAPVNGSTAPAPAAPAPVSTPAPSAPVSQTPSSAGQSPSSGAHSGGASLRDAFKNRGYDTSAFQDDDTLLNTIDQQLAENERLAELARHGEQYLEHQSSFEEWLAEKQAKDQAAAAAAAKPAPSPWDPPEFDESWMARVGWDEESGRFLPKTINDREIANKVNAAAAYQRKVSQHFARNPTGFLDETYAPKVKELVAAEIQAYHDRQQVAAQANQLIQKNLDRWVQRDEQGRDIGLTLEGQAVAYYAEKAQKELGITDPARKQEYALAMAQRDMLIFAQQAAQQPAPQGAAPNAPAPQGSGGERPRGPDGKFLPAAAAPAPKQTFLQNAVGGDHNPNRAAAEVQLGGDGGVDIKAMMAENMRKRGLMAQNG